MRQIGPFHCRRQPRPHAGHIKSGTLSTGEVQAEVCAGRCSAARKGCGNRKNRFNPGLGRHQPRNGRARVMFAFKAAGRGEYTEPRRNAQFRAWQDRTRDARGGFASAGLR